MEKFFKIRFIAFIVYIALQILLFLFILIISISEAVRDSGSLSFLQGLVSCGPSVLFGLINAFLLIMHARKKKKLLMVIALVVAIISVLYYLAWFIPVISRNMSAIILRINGDATSSATVYDYFLIVSHFGFVITMVLSTLICGFLYFAYYKKNKTSDFIYLEKGEENK